MHEVIDEPLRLPAPAPPPARPTLPIAAAIVPVVGAIVLWQLTGSAYALWFAALGPLMAGASFIDGVRGARRARRRDARAAERALVGIGIEVDERHDEERRRAWRRTPDVAGYADDSDEVWRVVPGRSDVIVVGRGVGVSAVRVEGDGAERGARELRQRARTIDGMPVLVPASAGIAVCGPAVWTAAVVRALVLQVGLTQPPGQVRMIEQSASDAASLAAKVAALPHAEATRGKLLWVGAGDRPLPADVDIPIVHVTEGAPPPLRCAAVLTLLGGDRARLDHDGMSRQVRVEAVSTGQAQRVAEALAGRAATLGQRIDGAVALSDLPVPGGAAGTATLAASVGISAGEPVVLDLVADGPHAVVIGVTGSGKSELLTSWIVGMCRSRSPHEVTLLLVDFKGGRTFDALAALPHVTGVLTDLDTAAALRAVESLRAEMRHRERVLAECDARGIDEAGDALARLVIVVDEYAALVAAHPELHELFADVAARGRALGMHLVLASQRATGSFRDALLANAPLRIAFRVTDAADSRAVLGQDDAALLPGGAGARGTALVRRAADTGPRTVRIAQCDDALLHRVLEASAGLAPGRRPWLPPLPAHIGLGEMGTRRIRRGDGSAGAVNGSVVLGLADEPERQRQSVFALADGASGLAVIGGPGCGRTTLLRTVAAQATHALWVPADPEGAWDAIEASASAPRGTTVLIDDADLALSRLPAEHAGEWVAALDRLAREARSRGLLLVLSAARVAGPLGRLIDLLPSRAILALPSRSDHVAAGGEAPDFVAGALPGRGRWGRTLVQFALPTGDDAVRADAITVASARRSTAEWMPGVQPAAIVIPAGPRADGVRAVCERAGARVVAVEDAATLEPGFVLIGSPEAWLAQWRLLSTARARADLVVDAACAGEYRALTGRRELPPYAQPAAARAWLHHPDGAVRRVILPSV